MRREYGVPYKGSKNKLVPEIIGLLPEATNFYDLFAGGCAVTHGAILSGKYKHFYVNDLDGKGVTLFLDSSAGKYHSEDRWVTREEFFQQKDTDPYVSLVWSFGNNMSTYMYGAEIEPVKMQVHKMLTAKTLLERRLEWYRLRNLIEKGDRATMKAVLGNAEEITRTERLQRLEGVTRGADITATRKDYREVSVEPDSVIYCDPPYAGTPSTHDGEYGKEFDYCALYDWALRQTELVVFSEYTMPDGFTPIWGKVKTTQWGNGGGSAVERLYIPTHQVELWKSMMGAQETMVG